MYIALVVSTVLVAPPASEPPGNSAAAAVIDKHLAAYNAHALGDFMAFFSPEAALFEFPDKPLAKGTAEIRKRYEARFAEPNLHVEIVNRIVMGEKVIDREQIRRTFPEGPGTWNVVVINEVKGGRVTNVWFIYGEKILDKK
jgi:hypothetical protein